ncbi:TIGR04219 family outer membrane beta-barrel protein [Spiribacter vilamensis]|uniref:Outer membrane protein n=1 Tax=Spiribacter vilamensis TaxID=531306 RepID=A0A4Q8CY35_9GAMM|nr:TIGR04219 family outer membrane beta-barrel protein [Spiribacter vilamensis]RZU97873.1 outer membrane protein [Spiribacter vilamensis]TVO61209.1 TIGR04219 family outer membrane beta-barrel protein [Spiribacter vilamensis]
MTTRMMTAIATGALGLAAIGSSQAADFSFRIGGGSWDQNLSGQYADEGSKSFDLEDDAGLSGSSNGYLYAQLEHPVFLLPNIRLERSSFDEDGRGTFRREIDFGGKTYNIDESVDSTFEIKQTDIIAYYSVLDTLVDLDLGLDVRLIDADVSIRSRDNTKAASESVSAPVPMGYAAVRVDVPGTGAYVRAQGSGIGFDGSSFIDTRALVGYTSDFGIGVELGYRRQELEIDDIDDIDGDVTLEGGFAGVHYAF